MEQYKRILLEKFDTRQKVITELTNLEAILNLPKGTELYISDIHGEFAAFDYILRSCAGILNEKINDCFKDSLTQEEKKYTVCSSLLSRGGFGRRKQKERVV